MEERIREILVFVVTPILKQPLEPICGPKWPVA